MTGIIIKNGYIVAEWGEPFRVDMAHSVTKSFLSTVVGLAYDRKMIRNLQAPVYQEIAPIMAYNPGERFDTAEKFGKSKFVELFETEHNRQSPVTHFATDRDWEARSGQARCADVPTDVSKWLNRTRNAPGAFMIQRRALMRSRCGSNMAQALPQVLRK